MITPKTWFIENGCELTRPSIQIFLGVYNLSNGNPCNGCNCKDICPAWPKLSHPSPSRNPRLENLARCSRCKSLLNPSKVARRGGKCACGETVR